MAKICSNCGKELSDNAVFCTECGTKLAIDPVAVSAEPEASPISEPQEAVQPVEEKKEVAQPQPTPAPPPKATQPKVAPAKAQKAADIPPVGKYAPTSVMAFFGMIVLFSIPIIGWITCFVLCFAAKKQSTKNFARALTILFLVCVILISILTVITVLVLPKLIDYVAVCAGDWVVSVVTDVLEEYTGEEFTKEDLYDLLEDAGIELNPDFDRNDFTDESQGDEYWNGEAEYSANDGFYWEGAVEYSTDDGNTTVTVFPMF